jgi:hypothetical protein
LSSSRFCHLARFCHPERSEGSAFQQPPMSKFSPSKLNLRFNKLPQTIHCNRIMCTRKGADPVSPAAPLSFVLRFPFSGTGYGSIRTPYRELVNTNPGNALLACAMETIAATAHWLLRLNMEPEVKRVATKGRIVVLSRSGHSRLRQRASGNAKPQ